MHLRSVEIFCEVVHQRSFSKAAEVFNVSQSSVSQAVQSLEDRLGALLLDRSKRPFELTPAGTVYFAGCRKLLESFHAMEDQVHRLQEQHHGVGPDALLPVRRLREFRFRTSGACIQVLVI